MQDHGRAESMLIAHWGELHGPNFIDGKLIKPIKPKRCKDDGQPKGPRSAYLFMCANKRSEVKESNPSMTPQKVTAELGRIWREMQSEDKEPYSAEAAEDKVRYTHEMEQYLSKVVK